jgi:hypothetical protein
MCTRPGEAPVLVIEEFNTPELKASSSPPHGSGSLCDMLAEHFA